MTTVSLRNGFLGLCLLATCAPEAVVCAQQQKPTGHSTATTPQQNRLLVLKSGRVIRGKIRNRGNGYQIQQPAGRTFVGSEQVWMLVNDLSDAHRQMRDSYSTLTPDHHMELAQWCVSQKMWGTARRELLDALHLDPYREDVRRMLARVMQHQEQAAAAAGQKDHLTRDQVKQAALETLLPTKALGGLPRDLARQYTRGIQPLVSARCGHCHNPNSGREFVLQSLRGGVHARISEQNLTAVLGQLGESTAAASPLLTHARNDHGGTGRAPFAGRREAEHLQRLEQWSAAVLRERARTNSGPVPRGRHLIQQAGLTHSAPVATVDAYKPHDTNSASRDEQVFLTDALRRNRTDRFDPDVFNQRYRFAAPAESGLSPRP